MPSNVITSYSSLILQYHICSRVHSLKRVGGSYAEITLYISKLSHQGPLLCSNREESEYSKGISIQSYAAQLIEVILPREDVMFLELPETNKQRALGDQIKTLKIIMEIVQAQAALKLLGLDVGDTFDLVISQFHKVPK